MTGLTGSHCPICKYVFSLNTPFPRVFLNPYFARGSSLIFTQNVHNRHALYESMSMRHGRKIKALDLSVSPKSNLSAFSAYSKHNFLYLLETISPQSVQPPGLPCILESYSLSRRILLYLFGAIHRSINR